MLNTENNTITAEKTDFNNKSTQYVQLLLNYYYYLKFLSD